MAKNTRETEIFETLTVPKAVMALAIPTVISQIISIIYNFADTWYVGRTNNAAAVAALSVCMPVYVIMFGLANLFGIGGASVISRALGAKNPQRARHAFAFSLWGSLLLAALYALAVALFRPQIIPLVGGDGESYEYISDYMFWTMMIGALPTVVSAVFGHLVRAVGASRQASIGMSLGAILNIVLDPLVMFGLLPRGQEVVGAAIATLISNSAAAGYFIIYLARHRNAPVYTLNPRDISLKEHIPSDVLMIGFPAALSTILAMTSNIFANALVANAGNAAVAGMGIAKKINTLAFNITMGLTQGVLPLIGYSYAAKKTRRMKAAIWFTGACAVGFSCVCLVLFLVFDKQLVEFFIADRATVEFGTRFLDMIAFAVPLCAFTYSITTVFQATGQRLNSFVLSILRKGLLDIPGMFLWKSVMGVVGVTLATPIAELLSTGIAVAMVIPFMKKLKDAEDSAVQKICA